MVLKFEKRNAIAYLTLNRPAVHNTFNPELMVAMLEAWKEFRDDPGLRCAIITGSGNTTFCAGADLAKLIPLLTGARKPKSEADVRFHENPELGNLAILRDFQLFKPVIAAINGDAIAGGMELLYGTDIRVAADNARFGLQEAKWGIFPVGGSTVQLPRQIPYARAMELLLTGQLITAREMYDFGFLNRIVKKEHVMEEAEKYAKLIAKNGPIAVSAIKQSVKANLGKQLKHALESEMELGMPVFSTEDAQEGPRAFKEKRLPVFKGK